MSLNTVRISAETKMNNWGSLPVAFDNVHFDSDVHDEWARVTVMDGESVVGAINAGCKIRRTGFVSVQLFTKQWAGSDVARGYADEISALFSNTRDGSIRYETASGERIGHSDDFYQYNIFIPFIYDEGN